MLSPTIDAGKARPSRVRAASRVVPFASLPHAIGGDPRLKPVDRAVLLALLFYARDKAECRPSNESIGKRSGCSPATVKRSLARLEGAGHVARTSARPTSANPTGRTITLAWRVDDHYLDRAGTCIEGGGSTAPPLAAPIEPGVGSSAPRERDRLREKIENQENREAVERQRPTPAPVVPTPTPTPIPTPSSDQSDHTEGQAAFLAGLTDDQRVRFDSATRDRQASLLAPFASGFDPSLARMILAELPKSVPAPQASPPASTVEAIERLPGGQPSEVSKLAERLCRDFGTSKDRQLWRAFHQLGEQVWRGQVPVDVVLDSYRQALGPKSKNRGAVFATALRNHGWRP